MANYHDQFHEGGPEEFSDETVRRFLLGELSPGEQPLFEQRLFSDDGLDARVRLAEIDLADDYAFDRLSAPERDLFEERFLSTSDRRQQLMVSKVLRDRFAINEAMRLDESRIIERLRSAIGLDRPAWRIAFGVLLLVILFGTAWLVIKEPRIASQITNRIIPRRWPTQSAPREAGHPTNTSVPEHQATPSPMPVHDQMGAPAVSIVLAPAVSPRSSEVPAVNCPKGDYDVVRLQLVLQTNNTGPFRAEVLTLEGSSVFSAEALNLTDARPEIVFDIPARWLKTGDYQVKLTRIDGGASGNVASYYFRVQ